MLVEIIFADSTEISRFDVEYAYDKQACLCLQFASGLIRKFPWWRISSWAHYHGEHLGTRRDDAGPAPANPQSAIRNPQSSEADL